MKTVDARIEELEMQIRQLKFEIARKPAREAAPLAPRHGRWLGITRNDFTQGVDEFFEVDVYIWSETLQQWRKATGLPAPGFIRARDWYLNAGETVEKNTKVEIAWYETTWFARAMYCSPTDLEGFQSTLPPSPGEMEGLVGTGGLFSQYPGSGSNFGSSGYPLVIESSDAIYPTPYL